MKIGSVDIGLFGHHRYNSPQTNERNIELPLAKYFIWKYRNHITEIGAVTPYYYATNHIIIDMNDTHPLVNFREDARGFDYTNRNILSISTLEHIEKGYELFKRIIETANNYLITIPVNFNKPFDKKINRIKEDRFFMRYKDTWELGGRFSKDYPYVPGRGATAIAVYTNLPEFYEAEL